MADTPDVAEIRPLSASSLNDLMVCERRWAYGHDLDPNFVKGPPNKWLVLGTVVHSAIRLFYDGSDADAALKDAVELAREEGGDFEFADLHAAGLFGSWLKSGIPSMWTPTVQEEEVRLEVAGVPMLGYLDARDETMIVDWKTSTSLWDVKKKKDAWLQGTFYSMAKQIPKVRMVVMSHAGGYTTETHDFMVSSEDVQRLEAMCRVYGPRIQSKLIDDYAINPLANNWLCGPKWCDYWTVCPGGGSRAGMPEK